MWTETYFKVNQSYFLILGPAMDSISNPNSNQNNIASVDGRQQFKRLERNREINNKPFKFPTTDEYIRRIRWPSERHSVHAMDSEPAATVAHRKHSTIVFPRSESVNENELPILENSDMKPVAMQSNGINKPLLPNSVNISVFIENQTAIANGLEPLVYIDNDGVFQVKYVQKDENVSQTNDNRQHSNEQNLASINKTEETAIISNDNQQIPRDQRNSTETNNELLTTIDLIQDGSPINNTEMIFQWTEAHTKNSSKQQKEQQQRPSSPPPLPSSSDKKHPRLFNGHPIFA